MVAGLQLAGSGSNSVLRLFNSQCLSGERVSVYVCVCVSGSRWPLLKRDVLLQALPECDTPLLPFALIQARSVG